MKGNNEKGMPVYLLSEEVARQEGNLAEYAASAAANRACADEIPAAMERNTRGDTIDMEGAAKEVFGEFGASRAAAVVAYTVEWLENGPRPGCLPDNVSWASMERLPDYRPSECSDWGVPLRRDMLVDPDDVAEREGVCYDCACVLLDCFASALRKVMEGEGW